MTPGRSRRFRAPGKVFLAGEYAVLEGATAVIAAVARHAIADPQGPPSARPEVVAITAALGDGAPAPAVDVEALGREGRKLGLGSSAAALVACAGVLLERRGVDLGDPAQREALLPRLIEIHRSSQGGSGSGGDVAAALHGGVVTFEPVGPRVRPFAWPEGLELLMVDSGAPARTGPLAQAALDRGVPRSLHESAAALREGLGSGDRAALLAATALHCRGLRELSGLLGQALITPPLERVLALAGQGGVPAKPSGAGGGDLAIMLVACEECADLERRLQAEGFWAERALIDHDGAFAC